MTPTIHGATGVDQVGNRQRGDAPGTSGYPTDMDGERHPSAGNPWEARARTKKAIAIADYLWSQLDLFEIGARDLLLWIKDASEELRGDIAHAAGQRSPSDETWCEVCARIARMIEITTPRREWIA